MKIKITIVFFMICLHLFSQQVSGKIVYQASLNFTLADIEREEEKRNERLNYMRKLLKNAENIDCELIFSSNYSKFSVVKKLKKGNSKPLNLVYSRAGGTKNFYTSLITSMNVIQECQLLEECYIIEQPKLEWKLTQDTKVVGGYVCYKAINTNSKNKKMKPIAWYTPQIPASYGPKQFFGLPGLILQIEESAIRLEAKTVILNPKEKIEVKPPKGKKISKKQYDKKLKESYTDFYNK